jgi:hypothetical protein
LKTRNLKDGSDAQELDFPIDLVVHTKCPGKWMLIDLETGEHYMGQNEIEKYQQWKRLERRHA